MVIHCVWIVVIFVMLPLFPFWRDRSLCLSGAEEEFSSGRNLPFINPSSLETLRALLHEIQTSETDPEIWKNCEVTKDISVSFAVFACLFAVSYSGFWVNV